MRNPSPKSLPAIAAVLLMCFANAAQAQSKVADCARIDADAERLKCYDFASGRLTQSSESTGNWRLETKTNPMDDTTTVIAFLSSDEKGTVMRSAPLLVARCQSDTTEAYISFDTYLGDDSGSVYNSYKLITVRVDKDKAVEEKWTTSTDHKAAFAPNSIALLRQIANSDRLVVQTTPYGANPITAIFTTSGGRGIIEKIAGACNWTL